MASLNIPIFHAHFKLVAATSPIQYIKAAQLHQAELMMIRNHATTAINVGHKSTSHFSREFKPLFGRRQATEAREMRSAFALIEPSRLNHINLIVS